MKKQTPILTVAIVMVGLAFTFGQVNSFTDQKSFPNKGVENLLAGINSDNQGLRLSCAYYLGYYKISGADNLLVNMLQSDESEEGRIIAALALTQIGSNLGNSAIKQAAVFDKSEKVQDMCKILQKFDKR